jgi:hypothetical protein
MPNPPYHTILGRPNDKNDRDGPGIHKIQFKSLNFSKGPGAYNPPAEHDNRAFSLSGRNDPRLSLDVPGPGTYDASNRASAPAYSLRGRSPEKVRVEGPGPGAYDNTGNTSRKSPSYTMSSRVKRRDSGDYPGNVTYNFYW